jgi:DUF2934 family protein
MAKPKKRPEGDMSSASEPSPATGREAIHGRNGDYGDRVSQRAYELYLARGRADGRDFDDWIAAERELSKTGDASHE